MRSPRLTIPAALALLLGMAACSARPSPAPAGLVDPSPDVVVYDTEARFDLEEGTLVARSTLRFVPDGTTATSFAFRLGPSLEVQRIRGDGVRGHRTVAHEFRNEFIVDLDGAALPGGVVTIEIEYSGSPSIWPSMINEVSPDWVQLSMDSGWHPEPAHVGQVKGVLRLHLPPAWSVVGSGSTTLERGVHVMRNAIGQVDASFAAGPGLDRLGGEGFTIHVGDARRDEAPAVLDAARVCAAYLQSRFGAEDPMPHVHLVLAPRSRATFARKNFIPLSALGSSAVGTHRFICHELAHYWTSASGLDPANHWMSEAFAEYVAGMAVREHFGQDVFDRWVAGKEERGREHGPIWTADLTERVPDPAMYDRAPALLACLENRVGAERFNELVHFYMTRRIESTETLLAALARIAGSESAHWLRRELASSGARYQGCR